MRRTRRKNGSPLRVYTIVQDLLDVFRESKGRWGGEVAEYPEQPDTTNQTSMGHVCCRLLL